MLHHLCGYGINTIPFVFIPSQGSISLTSISSLLKFHMKSKFKFWRSGKLSDNQVKSHVLCIDKTNEWICSYDLPMSEKKIFHGEQKKSVCLFLIFFKWWIPPNRQKLVWSTSVMEVIQEKKKKEEHLNEEGKHTKPRGTWNHPHPSGALLKAGLVKSESIMWLSCAE